MYPPSQELLKHHPPHQAGQGFQAGHGVRVGPPMGTVQVVGLSESNGWTQGLDQQQQAGGNVTVIQESCCKRCWPWIVALVTLGLFCTFLLGPTLEAYSLQWFSGRCHAAHWTPWSGWSSCDKDEKRTRFQHREIRPAHKTFDFGDGFCAALKPFSEETDSQYCAQINNDNQASAPKPKLCIGNTWGRWSDCTLPSHEYVRSIRFRQRSIRESNSGAGRECHTIQTIEEDYQSCTHITFEMTKAPDPTTTTTPLPIKEDEICSCGGVFSAPSGVLCSPGYPETYADNLECVYNVTVPEGKRVAVQLLHLATEVCCDYLLLFEGHSVADRNLLDLASGYKNNTAYISYGNKITLKFITDSNVRRVGFYAVYFPVDQEGKVKSNVVTTTTVNPLLDETLEGEDATCITWFPFAKGQELRIYEGEVTQSEAEAICAAEGGRLALLNTPAARQTAWSLIQSNLRMTGKSVWIGLSRSGDDWVWADGTLLEAAFWGTNEPSNVGHCVLSQNGEKWVVAACNSTSAAQGFACQKLSKL